MSIQSLKDSKILRQAFERFGRAGISERIEQLVLEFSKEPSYYKAIHLAGRLRALAMAACADGYWNEKQSIGFQAELWWLQNYKANIVKGSDGEPESVTFQRFKEGES